MLHLRNHAGGNLGLGDRYHEEVIKKIKIM